MLQFAIEEMHLHAERIHAGATLYIPPVTVSDVKDHELAQLVDSAEHLKSITQQSSPLDDPRKAPKQV
jgi:hypothetical protein